MSWFKKGLKAISPLAMALNKENSVKIAAGGIGAGYSDPKQMAGGAAAGAMSPQQLAGGVGAKAAERRRGENNNAFSQQMLQQQIPGVLQQLGQPLPQGAAMPQYVRNQAMRNPPFYNPPPGQNMNMQIQGGMGQNMIDDNAYQGNFQEFLAGRKQGNVPSEAFQLYSQQQPQQSQPQAQRSGANAGRVRQSPGVYKDLNTGALYGNDGKLMRAGTRRMR